MNAKTMEEGKHLVVTAVIEILLSDDVIIWEPTAEGTLGEWNYTTLSFTDEEGAFYSCRVGVSEGGVVSVNGHPFDPQDEMNTNIDSVRRSLRKVFHTGHKPSPVSCRDYSEPEPWAIYLDSLIDRDYACYPHFKRALRWELYHGKVTTYYDGVIVAEYQSGTSDSLNDCANREVFNKWQAGASIEELALSSTCIQCAQKSVKTICNSCIENLGEWIKEEARGVHGDLGLLEEAYATSEWGGMYQAGAVKVEGRKGYVYSLDWYFTAYNKEHGLPEDATPFDKVEPEVVLRDVYYLSRISGFENFKDILIANILPEDCKNLKEKSLPEVV